MPFALDAQALVDDRQLTLGLGAAPFWLSLLDGMGREDCSALSAASTAALLVPGVLSLFRRGAGVQCLKSTALFTRFTPSWLYGHAFQSSYGRTDCLCFQTPGA